MSDLIDTEARAQAISDTSAHLLVEAGAGTGKTSVLVSKVIHLLKTDTVQIDEIAAITFTESAAQELRARIETELGKESLANKDNQNIARALQGLPTATITTIHGFAQSLLMRDGYSIGVPFGFTVVDESAAKYRLKNQLRQLLYKSLQNPELRNILIASQALGVSNYHLDELWKQCNDKFYMSTKTEYVKFDSEFQNNIMVSTAPKIDEISTLIVSCKNYICTEENDRLFILLRNFIYWQKLLPNDPTLFQVIEWLLLIREQKVSRIGNKTNWPGTDINDIRNILQEVFNFRKKILQVVIDSVLPMLASWFLDEATKISHERKLAGELRFQDLLVYCHEMLATNIEVREKVAKRYKYILVDEFQDTDQLQVNILRLLSNLPDGTQGSRLFYVGDPKQSIYRFRGADIDLYREVRNTIAKDAPLQLVTNFRSRFEILETVNKIFTHLLQANGDLVTKDSGEGFVLEPEEMSKSYDPALGYEKSQTSASNSGEAFQALVPSRTVEKSNIVFLQQLFDTDRSASERRKAESKAIAELIKKVVTSPWLVGEKNLERPATFGDIAIIIPRRTGLHELRSVLEEESIPYQLPSSDLIFSNQLVQDLIACIKAVVMPYKEFYVYAALRSALFGCSDNDLHNYRSQGGVWYLGNKKDIEGISDQIITSEDFYLNATGQYDISAYEKVLLAIQRVQHLNSIYKQYGIINMMAKLVDTTGVYPLAQISQYPAESQLALDYIINKIVNYGKNLSALPDDLLDFIEAEKDNYPRADLFEDDQVVHNAVRIVTIHASKGLEYPIVIMAELGSGVLKREKANIIFDDTSANKGIHIKINDQMKTSGYDEATIRYEYLSRAELYRLCYVAATRAQDHLVISLFYQPSSHVEVSLAEVIHNIVESDDSLMTKVKDFNDDFTQISQTQIETRLLQESKKTISDNNFSTTAESGFLQNMNIVDWKNTLPYHKGENLLFDMTNINFFRNITSECQSKIFSHLSHSHQLLMAIGSDNISTAKFGHSVFTSTTSTEQIKRLLKLYIREKATSKDSIFQKPERYSSRFLDENIISAYQIYKENLVSYVAQSNNILQEIPAFFTVGSFTFESSIDAIFINDREAQILDYFHLSTMQQKEFLSDSLAAKVNFVLACLRLGLHSLSVSSLGYINKECLLLYPVTPSSCSLFLFPSDQVIQIFQDFTSMLTEEFCKSQ